MSESAIPSELIYDSEERLRRADQLISDLRAGDLDAVAAPHLGMVLVLPPLLPDVLRRTCCDIAHVLHNLSASRVILLKAALDCSEPSPDTVQEVPLHDVVAQQLGYATSMLHDLENRLRAVMELIDACAFDADHLADVGFAEPHENDDPSASLNPVPGLQTLP